MCEQEELKRLEKENTELLNIIIILGKKIQQLKEQIKTIKETK